MYYNSSPLLEELMQTSERGTALERVKFALRKLEDLQSAEVAALSGATALSGVSRQVASIKENLRQLHSVLMSAEANWEDADSSAQKRPMELENVSKCTEIAIVTFLKEVQSIIPAHVTPAVFNNTRPVNFFALHKLKGEITKINSRVQRFNIKDLSEPSRKSITQPPRQFHPNIDEIWLLGLELHQECIVQKLVDSSLQTRSVVQVVGTQRFAKTALAQKIYQRYFKSYIQVTKFIIS